jgi:hypothetical protein
MFIVTETASTTMSAAIVHHRDIGQYMVSNFTLASDGHGGDARLHLRQSDPAWGVVSAFR